MIKHNYFLLITVFVSLPILAKAQDSEYFYYYKGNKIPLQVDYSRMTVVSEDVFLAPATKSSNPDFTIEQKGKSYTRQHTVASTYNIQSSVQNEYISEVQFPQPLTPTEYVNTIRSLQANAKVIKASPSFSQYGKHVGFSNNFYVKLFNEEDVNILRKFAEKYSIEVLRQNKFMPLWYTLLCNQETQMNAMEAANLFYESNQFQCVEPEFLYYDLAASIDAHFNDQWGLKNTGQYGGRFGVDIKAENAWSITIGAQSIIVAVFDDGIEKNHPDLQGTVGYNTSSGTNGNYHSSFSGTSAACPHVFGIAALILSVNPNLTVQQVNDIIESTAQKV
jgi:subtilisin family serine protease